MSDTTKTGGRTKLRTTTKKRPSKRRPQEPSPTRLKLPSGQEVEVELRYRDDLTIDWRLHDGQKKQNAADKKKKSLTCRGVSLVVRFTNGQTLQGVSKCAPEDNFDRYEGKRDAFLAIIVADNKQAFAEQSPTETLTIKKLSNMLQKAMRRAGLESEAEMVKELISGTDPINLPRSERNLLLPPEDRTALMKWLCPKFAQRSDAPSYTLVPPTTVLDL